MINMQYANIYVTTLTFEFLKIKCIFLTKREKNVFQLSQHHSSILHLVVQLETLNEVLE